VSSLRTLCVLSLLAVMLSGCDMLEEQINKQKLVGKAIGAACRQTGRSLEDCYARNPKTSKPDIFSGWKEMNEYMQAKKLDIIPPPPDIAAAPNDMHAANNAEEAAAEPSTRPAATSATSTQPAKTNAVKH